MWNVPDFDVEDLLHGRVHFDLLWNTLRDLDQLLETGKNVLLFCENGERHSAFVALCYLKSKCRVTEGKPYRNKSLFGYLHMLRSVIDPKISQWLTGACPWLQQWSTNARSTPCEKTTRLPFILKDSDFSTCCLESNYPGLQVVPGDKSKGEIDHLSVGTASGQERKGKQGADRQEGSTPAASGQDAAPVPVQNTASGQDAATVPDLNTASGQDAAPHTASNEGKVQKGSDGDEAVGSKQEPGPESQAHHGIKRTNEEIENDELLQ